MTATVATPQLPALLRRLRAVGLSCVLACAGVAGAQGVAGSASTAWSGLSPAQRGVLTPLERDWGTISPDQQKKWVEVANRFPTLPAEERTRVQQRITEWSRLSPRERGQARLNFQETRQLSPQERQQQWEAYRALPSDQRRALAEQVRPSAANARRGNGSDSNVKSSVVRAPGAVPARPVGPTVVQRGAGATTNLVSKPATPPLHQQAGLPKVEATPGFVDRATLLPQRGAQGAAAARAPAGADEKSKAK